MQGLFLGLGWGTSYRGLTRNQASIIGQIQISELLPFGLGSVVMGSGPTKCFEDARTLEIR